ncbi:MAG: PEP-CTERM sorting domain-containing protein [Candidatus Omnitrophica bacterium]|nr:PEP-CTERM sorting domain-containing protein [Candidatus Omnitrophota bacterium]
MQKTAFGKVAIIAVMAVAFMAVKQQPAFSAFEPDWGVSWDGGVGTGYNDVAKWLVNNGYYNDFGEATAFAQSGYIGHDVADPDPFFWSFNNIPVEFQIVYENAGFANQNTFGYYTGIGDEKNLSQIFNGIENGPKELLIGDDFGLYLKTPLHNTWFTDRSENSAQQMGILENPGGNAQALIYELKQNQQWLVAWEDLDATKLKQADRDFNDMYALVTVVPEPISSALFLLGGGVLAARRFKRKRS